MSRHDGSPPDHADDAETSEATPSSAMTDRALLAPDAAAYITRALLRQITEPAATDGAQYVYLVLHVLPLKEYDVLPDDGPEDWDLVAECFATIGCQDRVVLEAWPTWEQAQRRCLEIVLEEGFHLRHVVTVRRMRLGSRVLWWPPAPPRLPVPPAVPLRLVRSAATEGLS